MPTEADPIPGEWYINQDDGQRFQVVGLDDDERMVEIMHYNGDLAELPLREWYDMSVSPGEQPAYPAAAMDTDDSEGPELDYPNDDPVAAKLPSDQDLYRRRNVEYANKAADGYPGDKSEADEEGWGRDEPLSRMGNKPEPGQED